MPKNKIEQNSLNILSLFPTPVGLFELGRDLTQKELNFFEGLKTRNNAANLVSLERNVLQKPQMKKIREFIENSMNLYFNNMYKPKFELELYITQSWVNYTKNGESHHRHTHPNSIISGVFYCQSNDETDKIHFHKNIIREIKIVPSEFHVYNSDVWWIPAKTGTLLIFPSTLSHSVDPIQSQKTRISLSFNTFVKGKIGAEDELTFLELT